MPLIPIPMAAVVSINGRLDAKNIGGLISSQKLRTLWLLESPKFIGGWSCVPLEMNGKVGGGPKGNWAQYERNLGLSTSDAPSPPLSQPCRRSSMGYRLACWFAKLLPLQPPLFQVVPSGRRDVCKFQDPVWKSMSLKASQCFPCVVLGHPVMKYLVIVVCAVGMLLIAQGGRNCA